MAKLIWAWTLLISITVLEIAVWMAHISQAGKFGLTGLGVLVCGGFMALMFID